VTKEPRIGELAGILIVFVVAASCTYLVAIGTSQLSRRIPPAENFTREQMRQAFDCGYITGIEGPPFRESKKQCATVMGSIGDFYGDSFK